MIFSALSETIDFFSFCQKFIQNHLLLAEILNLFTFYTPFSHCAVLPDFVFNFISYPGKRRTACNSVDYSISSRKTCFFFRIKLSAIPTFGKESFGDEMYRCFYLCNWNEQKKINLKKKYGNAARLSIFLHYIMKSNIEIKLTNIV